MPLPAHRSLLYGTEQLPAYTPRQHPANDPETASIRSSAPSYVSATPSYHSSLPPAHLRASEVASSTDSHLHPLSASFSDNGPSEAPRHRHSSSTGQPGLPQSSQYAPGFENRGSLGSSNSGSLRNQHATVARLRSLYNVSEWVPVTEGLQAQHYRNVARRRASETNGGGLAAAASRTLFMPPFQPLTDPPSSSQSTTDFGTSGRRLGSAGPGPAVGSQLPERDYNGSTPTLAGIPAVEGVSDLRPHSPEQHPAAAAVSHAGPSTSTINLPLSPHEDPDLVGEEAAARFRSQRLYMAGQQEETYNNNNENQQAPAPSTGSLRPGEGPRVYQYSSLVSPAVASIPFATSRDQLPQRPRTSSSSQSGRPSNTSGSDSDASLSPNSEQQQETRVSRPRAATYQNSAAARRELDEALRAQESKTWDFMLSQMSDWQERERSWNRYKDEMDKRFSRHVSNLRFKPNMASWSATMIGIRGLKDGQQKDDPSGQKKRKKKKKGKDKGRNKAIML